MKRGQGAGGAAARDSPSTGSGRPKRAAAGPEAKAGYSVPSVLAAIREAQKTDYQRALREIRGGRKSTHWIWYVWPTLATIRPRTSRPMYLLPGIAGAEALLLDAMLRQRLVEITTVAVQHLESGTAAHALFGSRTDAVKFVECCTVFAVVSACMLLRLQGEDSTEGEVAVLREVFLLFCRCLIVAKNPEVMSDTLKGLLHAGAAATVCAVTTPTELLEMFAGR